MKKKVLLFCFLLIFVMGITLNTTYASTTGNVVQITEQNNPNYNMMLYSQIKPWLDKITQESNRVSYKIVGQSAGGRDIYEVIVTDPSAQGKLGRYQALRNTMLKDPAKAQEMIAQGADFKVPIFVNNSIHGGETTGVDAAVKLIEELAYANTADIQQILQNDIIIFNIDANPDGRINGWRENDNGFDCNRDMATQSQPETRAILDMILEWKPMVLLDNHGYVDPILIEPCGKPHNPNYEDDLYQKWALDVALAMEKELKVQGWLKPKENAIIPYRDTYVNGGWDDYPSIFIPQLAQFYALTTQTIEVGPRTIKGVTGHYITTKTALSYAAQNRVAMFNDQVEVFKRGTNFGGQSGGKFPYAYILPMDKNPQVVTSTINYLLRTGVDVESATQPFTANGKSFPAGTYIVKMNQPLAGLANDLLWKGEDIEAKYPELIKSGEVMYDIAAWNFPELWGFNREIVATPFSVNTCVVSNAAIRTGAVENENAPYLSFACDNNETIKIANELLAAGCKVYQANTSNGIAAGTFVAVSGTAASNILKAASSKYGINVKGISTLPTAKTELKKVKIAALTTWRGYRMSTGSSGSSGLSDIGPTAYVLRELGFDVDVLWPADLAKGLDAYNVIVGMQNVTKKTSGITDVGWKNLVGFFARGGKFVGYGKGGADFASSLGVLNNSYVGQSDYYNAIVNLKYDSNNPVTGSYGSTGFGFVYGPLYFKDYGAAKPIAWYDSDTFLAGYWKAADRVQFSNKVAIVGNDKAVLFGIDPVFRAHIKDSFRMLSNSIFSLTGK